MALVCPCSRRLKVHATVGGGFKGDRMDELDGCEIRCAFYGGLMMTSEQIKILRFELEMKRHYEKEREDHELLMHFVKLQSRTPWFNPFRWFYV